MITSRFFNKKDMSLATKASASFLICSIIQKCISLVSTPIFTRLLSLDEYALFSIYNNWYQIFFIFITFKLESGVFNKGMSKFSEEKDDYVTSMQGIVTVAALIYVLVVCIFQKSFKNMTELPLTLLILMAFHIVFSASVTFWSLRQRYEFKYKLVVVVTLLMSISNIVVGLIFVISVSSNRGLARVISIILVQSLIGGIIYFSNLKNSTQIYNLNHIKFVLRFNFPLIPHYLSMYVLNSSDRLMIQKMCGDRDVARYSVVYNIALVLLFVVDSINSSLAPWIYQRLGERKIEVIERKIFVISLGIGMILFCYILVAPEIVLIMAGKKYMEAVYAMAPITASVLCIFIYQLIGNIEFFYNANKFTSVVSMIGAILNLILNFIFIPLFGYVAAGYTTLICYVVFVILHTIYATILIRKNEQNTNVGFGRIYVLCIFLILIPFISSLMYRLILIRYALLVIFSIGVIVFALNGLLEKN